MVGIVYQPSEMFDSICTHCIDSTGTIRTRQKRFLSAATFNINILETYIYLADYIHNKCITELFVIFRTGPVINSQSF